MTPMAMDVIHISEVKAASDRVGAEVTIENRKRPAAVLNNASEPVRRTILSLLSPNRLIPGIYTWYKGTPSLFPISQLIDFT
jgi:hypothetical protein